LTNISVQRFFLLPFTTLDFEGLVTRYINIPTEERADTSGPYSPTSLCKPTILIAHEFVLLWCNIKVTEILKIEDNQITLA